MRHHARRIPPCRRTCVVRLRSCGARCTPTLWACARCAGRQRAVQCGNWPCRELRHVLCASAGRLSRHGSRSPNTHALRCTAASQHMRRTAASPTQVVDDSSANKLLLVLDYLEGGPVMTREGLGAPAWLAPHASCCAGPLAGLPCARRALHTQRAALRACRPAALPLQSTATGCPKMWRASTSETCARCLLCTLCTLRARCARCAHAACVGAPRCGAPAPVPSPGGRPSADALPDPRHTCCSPPARSAALAL